jgi:hypothetical protein
MPEKVRVSPAPAPQLSTGAVVHREDQAALLLDDEDEPPDDELVFEESPDKELPEDDESPEPEDEEEGEADVEADDSDFAGTEVLPVERLSFR